jgi:hypothetical protein
MTPEEEYAIRSQLKWKRDGSDWILLRGRRRMGRVIPDHQYPGMWRSPKSGGRISDMQDQRAYVWHHLGMNHAAGSGSVTTSVKLPTTKAHSNGFPTNYVVWVTPSQPCVASVSNQTPHGAASPGRPK